ncbi:hypothetical protein ACIRRH_43000 [Kitasatospora sp. NPDC101235]
MSKVAGLFEVGGDPLHGPLGEQAPRSRDHLTGHDTLSERGHSP